MKCFSKGLSVGVCVFVSDSVWTRIASRDRAKLKNESYQIILKMLGGDANDPTEENFVFEFFSILTPRCLKHRFSKK